MMAKKIGLLTTPLIFLLSLFIWGGYLLPSLLAQEQTTTAQQEPKKLQLDVTKGNPIYNPEGRRDPFRDLLAGRELKSKTGIRGPIDMSINDIILIGIVKAKNRFTAIINGPQGFPYYVKVGDKFADGFVLSITPNKVVFRKLKERGIPLMRPKDITKEINPEER